MGEPKKIETMNEIFTILNIGSTEIQNAGTILVKLLIVLSAIFKNGIQRMYIFYGRKLGVSRLD